MTYPPFPLFLLLLFFFLFLNPFILSQNSAFVLLFSIFSHFFFIVSFFFFLLVSFNLLLTFFNTYLSSFPSSRAIRLLRQCGYRASYANVHNAEWGHGIWGYVIARRRNEHFVKFEKKRLKIKRAIS